MTPGDSLGPYRLEARLARGAMGEVWAAEVTGDPPRGARLKKGDRVAVKLIPEYLRGDAAIRERLKREAAAIARLEHPGVVRMHAIGEENDLVYLVEELLQGETLAERLAREKPLPVPEIERIGGAIADALAYVHSRGIVHRDLKPQNVFLTPTGEAKLIDLGVAKIVDEASITVTGAHFGTPAYMSPESFRDSKSVTAATDIWSLGVMLYEMATGRLPFPGTNAASIIAKIADTNVTPQTPTHFRPELPEPLARAIGAAIARSAGERPTAAGLVETLTGRRWRRPVPGRKLIAVLGVIVSLLGLAISIWLQRENSSNARTRSDQLAIRDTSAALPLANTSFRFLDAELRIAVGVAPGHVRTGDFDGDGHMDVAVCHANELAILTGDGSGRFGNRGWNFEAAPLGIGAMIARDLNGDRDLDFAVIGVDNGHLAFFSSNVSVKIFHRLASGYEAGRAIPLPAPEDLNVHLLEAGDFNGDGLTDFACLTGPRLCIVPAGGDSATTLWPLEWTPTILTAGDWNLDGIDDLFLDFNRSETGAVVLLGKRAGGFAKTPIPLSTLGRFLSMAVQDLDGDGDLDIVAATPGEGNLVIAWNPHRGGKKEPARIPLSAVAHDIAVGDFNGDSRYDIAAALPERHSLAISFATNTGYQVQTRSVGINPTHLAAADFNRDGRSDLVVSNSGSGDLSILLGNVDETFTAPAK